MYTFEWVFRNNANVLAVDMNVRDTSGTVLFAQTLSSPGDLINPVVGGNRYLWFTFVNADKLALDNTVLERFVQVLTDLASGSVFPVGTNTVVCTATDACGNSALTNFIITVNDTERPTITAPADVLVSAALGQCVATNVVLGTPATHDNCAVAIATNNAPATFPLGLTVVTWTAADIHGNLQSATQQVTVVDGEAPTIVSCAGSQTLDADATAHALIPDLRAGVAAQDCSLPLFISQVPAPATSVGLGATTVTLFVADNAGNTNTCTATITVRDVTPPTWFARPM